MSFKKRFLAGSLAAVLTLGMATGCTTVRKSDLSDDYSTVVAATYGDENIYLDEVNYYLRNSQLMYEYYGAIYGTNIWENEGAEDALREEVMTSIYQTRVLCDHAEDYKVELTDADKTLIADRVSELLDSEGNQEFMEIAGSDEKMLTDLMTKNALANKVYKAIIDETEIKTTEEDNRQNSISYLFFEEAEEADETAETETAADETAETETTADETAEAETEAEETGYKEADAKAALKKVEQGTSLEDAGKDVGIDVSTTNFGVNEEQTTEFGKKAVTLKEGESAMVYEEGTGWYVMVCDSENDEDATASAYESAVEEEQSAHFSEVYQELDKAKFKVNEDVVKSLNIADTPVLNLESETEDSTEDVSLEENTAEDGTAEDVETEDETTEAE
ncbi:MAG: hypothetical protein SO101_04735 [Lachnospiraceae bacterium]|nr:hypothetical protein [Lachnospiraceae bacterium]